MPKSPRNPYEVRLTDDAKQQLASWLSQALQDALNARSASDAEVAYWHTLYEQGRTRAAVNTPWPDAADLTSAIGTEKVDAYRARIMRTIFVDPIWTVEGWGEAAAKAPFVEEFHSWQAETEGFQSALSRVIHLALIEPRGVLETYEDTTRRPVRKTIRAALQLDDEGRAVIGEDLQPVLQRAPDGTYVNVVDDQTPSADVVVDADERVCNGPRHRAVAYRDFLVLPGHAQDRHEVWGYAKRCWLRVDTLRERADQGVYDAETVEQLGTDDEIYSADRSAGHTTLAGEAREIPTQEEGLAQKELWEVLFLKALDRSGPRWYVATVHKDRGQLLRLQHDDIGRPRYFCFTPFPRADSTEGYSLIGHKLITPIEENTAWRNMLADRGALQVQAPMLRQQNALWDPDEEPIGPKAVLTVRDMNEIQPLQIPDYTGPARERIIDTERTAEKLAGLTDIASGSSPAEDRTATETRLVTAYAEVRIEEVVRNIQETLEEVAQVRHLMWERALRDMGDAGMEAAPSMLTGLETRGVDVTQGMPNRRVVASMLQGAFRFKPKGSVENADKHRLRRDFAESLQALSSVAAVNPMVASILQQPGAAKSLLDQWVRLYNIPDKQAFVGANALQMAMQQIQSQQQQAQLSAGGGEETANLGGSLAPTLPPEVGETPAPELVGAL